MGRRCGVLSLVVLGLVVLAAVGFAGCSSGDADPSETLVEVQLLDGSGRPASAHDVQVMLLDREPETVGATVTYVDVARARTSSDGRATLRGVDDDRVRAFVASSAPAAVQFLVVAFDDEGRGWNCRFRRAAAAATPDERPLSWTGPTPQLVLRPDGVCADSTAGGAA